MALDKPDSEPNETPAPHPATGTVVVVQKKRGFLRRTRQTIAWLLLIVLILAFAGMLFIQLPVFKRLVVGQLVSLVEQSTNGTLSIGQIRGNLLEGFVMDDVTLRLKTGTPYDTVPFIHADQIIARYSLLRYLRRNEFGIEEMVLENPVVRLVKFAGDTNWNYSLLTKPVPTAPKAPPQRFTQIVDLRSFRIQNGSIYVRNYDYPARGEKVVVPAVPGTPHIIAAPVKENEIDWSDMHVAGLDLDSRFYTHGADTQRVQIHHLGFTESESGFFVQHLELSALLDSAEASIQNAKLTTGHSDLDFSLDARPPKIIKTGLVTSMKNSEVTASVRGPVISTYELKQLFPGPLGFLAGSPGISLTANGEFGKLHLKQLVLDFKGEGYIDLTGNLENLQQADSLSMDLSLQGRNLSNTTLDDYVPGLHLPNIARFGTISIPTLTYDGEPLDFHTKFEAMSSGAGNVSGDVILDLRHNHIVYRAGVKAEHFNVAALAQGKQYESSITAQAQFAGNGTNWKTMNSTIVAKTNGPSTFGKYRITSLDADGAIDRGTLTANHLDLIVAGGPEAHVRSAMVGLTQKTLPFRFDGTVKDFHLADLLGTKNPARVDLDANMAGSATDFEDLTGTAHARLFDLEYRGHILPDDTADLKILPSAPGENMLTFRSQIADVIVQHRFQLGNITEDLPRHLNALISAIENREFPPEGEHFPVTALCPDSIDFSYRIRIKDLRPLADFLPRTFLLGEGTIYGTVEGCPDGDLNLTVSGDSLAFIVRNRKLLDSTLIGAVLSQDTMISGVRAENVDSTMRPHEDSAAIWRRDTSAFALPHFEMGTPRIQMMPTTIRLVINHLANDPKAVLDHLDGTLDVLSDSVDRLGSALLYEPKVGLVYKDQSLTFDAATVYNDAFGLHLKGTTLFPNGNLDCTLDTLLVNYLNPYPDPTGSTLINYTYVNEEPAHIRLYKDGSLKVDTIKIVHSLRNGVNPGYADAVHLKLAGMLAGDTIDAGLIIPSFQLEDLKKIVPPFNPNAKTFDFAEFNGDVRDMNVRLFGTLERPQLIAKVFADTLSYADAGNAIHFDSNALFLNYRDQALRGALVLHAEGSKSTLPGNGNIASHPSELHAVIDSIPMTIALKRGPSFAEDSARAAVRPLAAHINASDFPLDVATPFLPPFRQVIGTGDIHFAVSGTRQNIDYSGMASIRQGAVLLAATNMWYNIHGPLSFAHNALTLENDSVSNIQGDDPNGNGILSGSLNFNGFDITNFDLALNSKELMVLSDASKQALPIAYGPVIVNTGGTEFHFHNTFAAPWINGTINVMSAKITMPQTNAPTEPVSNAGIIYEREPNDSIVTLRQQIPTSENRRKALAHSVGAESVQLSTIDDSLFPNRMKNLYLNDDGTLFRNDSSEIQSTAPAKNQLTSFADILRMDLRINTEGTAAIKIPLSALGFLGSQLNAELKSGGTLSIERGNDLQTHANGAFDLSPNSTFTFYQTFNVTEGNITFTNDFSNPNIDVTAEYTGNHQKQSGTDNARVVLRITGTKDQPVLTAQIFEEGPGGTFEPRFEPTPEAAKEDAIYFLATGQFKNELTVEQAGNPTSGVLQSMYAGLGQNLLNNFIGSTTQQVAIRSLSLNYGNTAPTGGQITASILRDITLKIGGYNYNSNIAPGSTPFNLNLTTDIPLSYISNAPIARQMMVEIQWNTNPTVSSANVLTQQPIFLSKLVMTLVHF